jgi:hypothetical protein
MSTFATDGTVVWSDVTYTTHDNGQVRIPVVTIFRRNDDGLIVDYRIFMDAAPLFARRLLGRESDAA